MISGKAQKKYRNLLIFIEKNTEKINKIIS